MVHRGRGGTLTRAEQLWAAPSTSLLRPPLHPTHSIKHTRPSPFFCSPDLQGVLPPPPPLGLEGSIPRVANESQVCACAEGVIFGDVLRPLWPAKNCPPQGEESWCFKVGSPLTPSPPTHQTHLPSPVRGRNFYQSSDRVDACLQTTLSQIKGKLLALFRPELLLTQVQ